MLAPFSTEPRRATDPTHHTTPSPAAVAARPAAVQAAATALTTSTDSALASGVVTAAIEGRTPPIATTLAPAVARSISSDIAVAVAVAAPPPSAARAGIAEAGLGVANAPGAASVTGGPATEAGARSTAAGAVASAQGAASATVGPATEAGGRSTAAGGVANGGAAAMARQLLNRAQTHGILGQDAALSMLARLLNPLQHLPWKRSTLALGLIGPPGVGKTTIAQWICDSLCIRPPFLITVDGCDYSEDATGHSAAKLQAKLQADLRASLTRSELARPAPLRPAPQAVAETVGAAGAGVPGVAGVAGVAGAALAGVGVGQAGVMRVVLFDNFESACPAVRNSLRSLLERATVTRQLNGDRVVLTNTLILLVGNGDESLGQRWRMHDALQSRMAERVVVFATPTQSSVSAIVADRLRRLGYEPDAVPAQVRAEAASKWSATTGLRGVVHHLEAWHQSQQYATVWSALVGPSMSPRSRLVVEQELARENEQRAGAALADLVPEAAAVRDVALRLRHHKLDADQCNADHKHDTDRKHDPDHKHDAEQCDADQVGVEQRPRRPQQQRGARQPQAQPPHRRSRKRPRSHQHQDHRHQHHRERSPGARSESARAATGSPDSAGRSGGKGPVPDAPDARERGLLEDARLTRTLRDPAARWEAWVLQAGLSEADRPAVDAMQALIASCVPDTDVTSNATRVVKLLTQAPAVRALREAPEKLLRSWLVRDMLYVAFPTHFRRRKPHNELFSRNLISNATWTRLGYERSHRSGKLIPADSQHTPVHTTLNALS